MSDQSSRITVNLLPRKLYDHAGHPTLADRGRRRYHPYSFDFDSTPMNLKDPEPHWDDQVKKLHLKNREQLIERIKLEYGTANLDRTVQDMADLGSKAMSLITYHNGLHEQARRAFVAGQYYPALVAACALGERILNHLILDLRDQFQGAPHQTDVAKKESFNDWSYAVRVLKAWDVLLDPVARDFIQLARLRHRSIHFNPSTYNTLREDALGALRLLVEIIRVQFGYFGGQPWFIENTPGAQFVRQDYEQNPFVKTYIIPVSGFVGPHYGMDLTARGWQHLDYSDYGDGAFTDDEFAQALRDRDPAVVVTREMITKEAAVMAADDSAMAQP